MNNILSVSCRSGESKDEGRRWGIAGNCGAVGVSDPAPLWREARIDLTWRRSWTIARQLAQSPTAQLHTQMCPRSCSMLHPPEMQEGPVYLQSHSFLKSRLEERTMEIFLRRSGWRWFCNAEEGRRWRFRRREDCKKGLAAEATQILGKHEHRNG
jgi:hypothetical protein